MADAKGGLETIALKEEDRWILSKVNEAVREVTANMDRYELALAGQKINEVIWDEYCDWYIELVKVRLYGEKEEDKRVARYVLVKTLKDMLTMLHPFMPYITEEIWSYLPGNEELIIRSPWPIYDEKLEFQEDVDRMELAMEIIRSIRNIRAEAEALPSRKLRAVIFTQGDNLTAVQAVEHHIRNLANLTEIQLVENKEQVPEEVMSAVIERAEIYIPLDDLLDYKAEYQRLEKERERLSGEVQRTAAKLENSAFVSKAPEQVVTVERDKLSKYKDMLVKVEERLTLVAKKL
jgi:valyl-tRNA synthetase